MGVFDRLSYNFETDRFGSAINLSNGANNLLNVTPSMISGWQISDLANGSIIRTDYYKNPLANTCTELTANLINIVTLCNTDPANTFPNAANAVLILSSTANTLIVEVGKFKTHTDNIAGVSAVSSDSYYIPFYDTMTSLGTQMVNIINKSDGMANTLPYLGGFSSLFIVDEVRANNAQIGNNYSVITNSFIGEISIITEPTVNTMIDYTQSVTNLLNTRRTEDWQFYQNSLSVVRDYMFLSKFTNMGNTQNYLVQNVIGTDLLKSKLSSNT